MRNTTGSELLLRSGDRVLPWVCFWGGMRPGGDVLHLYGWLSGRRAGFGAAGGAETFVAGAIPTAFQQKELIFAGSDASKKLSNSFRVEVKKLAPAMQLKRNCRIVVPMLKSAEVRKSYVTRLERVEPSTPFQCCASLSELLCESLKTSESLQTTVPVAAVCARPVADAGSTFGKRPSRPQAFCRQLRTNAVAGHISTGASRTNAGGVGNRASAIVLVTTLGNVTASLQKTPRG